MTSFNTFPKWHDSTGGASGGQLRRAITQRHSHNISGRPLLPDRYSAGLSLPLARANSRAFRLTGVRSGLYSFNAQLHVSRQAVRNALYHPSVLSEFRSRRCNDANRSILTDAQILFAETTKARTHD